MSYGRLHHLAIEHLGRCDCPCHHGDVDQCWCKPGGVWPYRLAHNDALRLFGACPLPRHDACRCMTEPVWSQALSRFERRERDRRIARGQIRNASDLNYAIRTGRLRGR